MKKKPRSTSSRKQPAPARRPAKTTAFSWARYLVYAEFVAILALAFITYGNSIKNDYNLDDGYVVSLDNANPLTAKGIAGIPQILTSKYNAVEGLSYGYRPLGKVTMAIEYTFWGNNPHVSHFINVLLFAVNCFLLLLFVKRIAALLGYANTTVIYLGMLLFIVHPIHTEVVCSIKNREEILCFIFMLISLLCYLRFIGKERAWWNIPAFAGSLFIALLAKQTAFNILGITLLVSMFIYLLKTEEEKLQLKKLFKGIFTPQTVFFVLLISVIIYIATGYIPKKIGEDTMMRTFENDPLYYFSQSHKFGNGAQTVLFYITKLFVPYPLLFYYGYNMLPDRGWDSVFPYIALLAFAGVIALVWYLVTKKRNLFLIFWVLFFCITIFPFSNFGMAQYITGIVAERLVFQASAGFCLVLAIGLYAVAAEIQKRMKNKPAYPASKLTWWMGAVFILPFFVITIHRNTHWKDKQTLYDHDIPHLTQSARANYMVASSIMLNLDNNPLDREQAVEKARQHLMQAVKISPRYNEVWVGLGTLYSQYLSRNDSAMACLGRVDTADNDYVKALIVYGDIYMFDSSDAGIAMQYYNRAFSKNQLNQPLYNKMSQVLYKSKKFDSLGTFADVGIKNNWVEGFINKGDFYFSKHDTATAVKYYQQAVDRGFRQPRLLRNLAYYYNLTGQYELLNRLPR